MLPPNADVDFARCKTPAFLAEKLRDATKRLWPRKETGFGPSGEKTPEDNAEDIFGVAY